MKKLILINGKKRSGKDYIASELESTLSSQNKKVGIMSFAEPLKNIIAKTFDISDIELEKYKNNDEDYGLVIQAYPNNQPICNIKYIDFRTILQRFGTEAMKPIFGDNVWAKILYTKVLESDYDIVIVPDFRFKIEYIPKYETIDIFKLRVINNKVLNDDIHSSETELNDWKFDLEIDNTEWSEEVLTKNIDKILSKFKL